MEPLRYDGAYDIETEGWDRFFCGALRTADGTQVFRHDQEREMVEAMLAVRGTLWAHNGGRFDVLWFLDAAMRHGLMDGLSAALTESGSSVICAELRGRGVRLQLRDSYALAPIALAKWGAKTAVGVACRGAGGCAAIMAAQVELGIERVGCGGYCAISRRLPAAVHDRIIEYCAQDCAALESAIDRTFRLASAERIVLGPTPGSTAWKTATADGGIGPSRLRSRDWEWIRGGYYGGRVLATRGYSAGGWTYDITSSYPAQARQALPDGEHRLVLSPSAARRAYARGTRGIYSARVSVPECAVPALPYRSWGEDGQVRNAYPIGTFVGRWPDNELRYAEATGVAVEPLEAMTFASESSGLAPTIDRLISARLRLGKGSPEGALMKAWANSLYGKMAQQAPETRIMIGADPRDLPAGATPINARRRIWRVPLAARGPAACGHIEKASTISAGGRVALHRFAVAVSRGEDAVYADTDSLFCEQPRQAVHGTGDRLGDWSVDASTTGRYRDLHIHAPKVYRADMEQRDLSWTPRIRAKGLPVPRVPARGAIDSSWRSIVTGEPQSVTTGVAGLRSAARSGGGLFRRRELVRCAAATVSFGDRIPDGRGGSRPPDADELRGAGDSDE